MYSEKRMTSEANNRLPDIQRVRIPGINPRYNFIVMFFSLVVGAIGSWWLVPLYNRPWTYFLIAGPILFTVVVVSISAVSVAIKRAGRRFSR